MPITPSQTTRTERAQAFRQKLHTNESYCISNNLIVRVHQINSLKKTAHCSVEQRIKGLFRRTYSRNELILHAEKALAPLIGIGISPMITVRHSSTRNTTSNTMAKEQGFLIDLLLDWWRSLGIGGSLQGFGAARLKDDPFGWQLAMTPLLIPQVQRIVRSDQIKSSK